MIKLSMLKVLGWIQVLALVVIILMTPCTHCHGSVSPDGTASFSQPSAESPCENEDHHFCHSINCNCGTFFLLTTRFLMFGLTASEMVIFSEPPQLLSRSSTDIFQPPRILIA